MSRAACTIIAKNYLAQARVLAKSFRRHHPEARCFVLLVDEAEGRFEPASEPFELVRLDELRLPAPRSLCFKYSVTELSTAVKPAFLRWLVEERSVSELLYLDPDIEVFDTLDPLFEALQGCPIALTPHITTPVADGLLPDERTFLRVGAYNLGFIGVRADPTALSMLTWWDERCAEHARARPDLGLFVDQKWVDLVPGLFPPVAIVADPGCNVAYWNLAARRVARAGRGFTVNGAPLRFFHFSGYDPARPDEVSRHQTRLAMSDAGEAAALFDAYRSRLLDEGWRAARSWPYTWGRFDDGTPIAPVVRDLYLGLGSERERFGDPFAADGDESFRAWLTAPSAARPGLSNLMVHVAEFHAQVHRDFHDPTGTGRAAFVDWLQQDGYRELELPRRFVRAPDGAARPRDDAPTAPAANAAGRPRSRCPTCMLVGALRRLGLRPAVRHMTFSTLRPAPLLPAVRRDGSVAPTRPSLAARAIGAVLRPCERHHGLGNLLASQQATRRRAPVDSSPATTTPGVNLAGYLRTESGVGQAARQMAAALARAELPHVLIDIEAGGVLRRTDTTLGGFARSNPHSVNLVHVNADQVPDFAGRVGRRFFEGRRNIGYWQWELPAFPDLWRDSFRCFDEIWTPSRFSAEAIRAASPVTTRCVPLPVSRREGARLGREHFRLPRDRFVFLFVFDCLSVVERKNPLAAVQAFRSAFAPTDPALLVLKCAHGESDPESLARLRQAAGDPRIVLIDRSMTRAEVDSLIDACDAYVSLHRSEGFGLTLAEAMLAGKPVIATNWSGNTDFMTEDNSFPVRYGLVQLETDVGPYRRGSRWAEPDVEHAGQLMRHVYEHPDDVAHRVEQARRALAERYSPAAVARTLRAMLPGPLPGPLEVQPA